MTCVLILLLMLEMMLLLLRLLALRQASAHVARLTTPNHEMVMPMVDKLTLSVVAMHERERQDTDFNTTKNHLKGQCVRSVPC